MLFSELFSDNSRWLKVFLVFLVLGAFVFYAQIRGPQAVPGFKEFEENPAAFEGRKIGFAGKVLKVNDNNLKVEQILDGKKKNLDLQGNFPKVKIGDQVFGTFIYQKDAGLVVDRYIISNTRPIKVVISFIALLWIFILFFRNYKFDFKSFTFLPKDTKNNFSFLIFHF